MSKVVPLVPFEECKAGFAACGIPIWVTDVETIRITWANAKALELWQASSIEELRARDLMAKIPESVAIRLERAIRRLLAGELVEEDWTFYPKGKPTVVLLRRRATQLEDGSIAMLNETVPIDDGSSATIRALAMLRHTKVPMVFIDPQGDIYSQNAAAIVEFGETSSWFPWLADQDVAREILRDALGGKMVDVETSVESFQGPRTHRILAQELRDPVTGNPGVFIHHFDVTERVEAERLVQTQLERLHDQQQEILDLSTPFLDVGARTLALPLIGRIDESRASEITARLLQMVANRNIERVILDITGVASVDAASLAFLRRLVGAIALLGAKPIVTGIRSDLARVLTTSDQELSGITIKRSLADGLAEWRQNRPMR